MAPQVQLDQSWAIDEGDLFTYTTGSFTDPGADTWQGWVDYGDGKGWEDLTTLDPITKSFYLEHDYYHDDGQYTVKVKIRDDDGGENPPTEMPLTVLNVARGEVGARRAAPGGCRVERDCLFARSGLR